MNGISDFSTLFLVFLAYSFIGWVSEVFYCFMLDHRWTNRGFLHGPLCPIYGFGALLVIGLLEPLGSDVFVLFSAAVFLTSALEYVSSWVLEALFQTKWWDYSDLPLNLHGRVCLRNSLMFGVMGVIGVRLVHPVLLFFASRPPASTRNAIASVLAVLLAADFALTLHSLAGFRSRLAALRVLIENIGESAGFAEWFSEVDLRGSLTRLRERAALDVSGVSTRLAENLESLIARSRTMRRLLHAFPGMTSRKHGRHLEMLMRLHERLRAHSRGRRS
jgi:uncharacterized membrane protein